MKANELMIGDWVNLINTTHNVSFPENGVIQDEGYTTICTPIKTTTVSENCVSYYSNKLEIYITISSEGIEPIPLTPEILEKNGFIKGDTMDLGDEIYCVKLFNIHYDNEERQFWVCNFF